MNFKEIQELIKLVAKTELSEFKLKDGEFSIHLRGKDYSSGKDKGPSIINMAAPAAPAYAPAPAAASAPAPAAAPSQQDFAPKPAAAADDTSKYLEVKSPMIGTFYRAASPDKDAYVKVGDKISVRSTVCVIEAMKLFNEIEAEVTGKIVKVMVEDAQPVRVRPGTFPGRPRWITGSCLISLFSDWNHSYRWLLVLTVCWANQLTGPFCS